MEGGRDDDDDDDVLEARSDDGRRADAFITERYPRCPLPSSSSSASCSFCSPGSAGPWTGCPTAAGSHRRTSSKSNSTPCIRTPML